MVMVMGGVEDREVEGIDGGVEDVEGSGSETEVMMRRIRGRTRVERELYMKTRRMCMWI